MAVFINDLGGISHMELNIIAKESIAYLGMKLRPLVQVDDTILLLSIYNRTVVTDGCAIQMLPFLAP